MSADTSEGRGGDNGAMVIYNETDRSIVLTARGNRTEIEEFSDIYLTLASRFKVLNVPEDDGREGRQLVKAIQEAGLPMFYSPEEEQKKRYRKPGYIPSQSRNAEILTIARRHFKNIELRCPRLLQEVGDYDWNAHDNDGRDSSGGHFDLLRPTMICVYASMVGEQLVFTGMNKTEKNVVG